MAKCVNRFTFAQLKNTDMIIRQATIADLYQLARAFDRYRLFYQQASDLSAAQKFLQDRLENEESIIFIALDNDELTGFTQLYPSFTSVGMDRIWVLNDLFVRMPFRQRGIAAALLRRAISFARETGQKKVVLSTGFDNHKAQRLYEREGFVKEDFYNYEYTVSSSAPEQGI